MSPANARPRTLYILIFLNVVLAAAFVVGVIVVGNLYQRLNDAEDRSYAGCVRGNVLRELGRHVAKEPGSPVRATNPALKEQPCALIYPGGAP